VNEVARIDGARFGHVNITSADWRRLATFYQEVFGMEIVPPERDIRSADLDAATRVRDAHLTGAHLRLPGLGAEGPTLEIYQYESVEGGRPPRVDRAGWGHIAFQVPDVPTALEAFMAAGGSRFGEVITTTTKTGAHVTWCYAADPDDNLVELQAWS
jgi:catechol 2,3-dioxygenase-like lactoylglutathione lyase family enzyme